MASTLPSYSYDPVTQTYRLMTPEEEAQAKKKQGLGSLDTLGGAVVSPSVPGPNDARFSMSPFATEVAVNAQNFGQMHKSPTSIVSPVMSAFSAISESAANKALGSQVNPVAAPVAPTVTAIAPTQTANLTAMNAQQAAQDQQQTQQTSVADVAQDVADAVAATADATDAEAGAAVGTTDSGGGDGAGGGGPGGPGDGVDNADSTNADSTGESSDAWAKGGQVMTYAQGGIADAYKTQARGRGPDTMLVHMSPKEVQGLQALAMAHGGSLTINPKTGLPEAGFLDSILPMVAGAALTGLSGGLINPMTAGLIVGGGTALMSGDLSKGFMAGLGAFGGAGIGAGLAGAGASTTTGQIMTPATANATQVAAQPVASTAMSSVAPESFKGVLAANGTLMPQTVTPAMNQVIGQQAAQTAVQQAAAAPTMSGMGQGIQNLVTGAPGAGTNFMTAVGGPMNLAKYGGAAAAPLLSGGLSEEGEALPTKTQYIRPYKYDAGRKTEEPEFKYRTGAPGESTSELTYFSPAFTAQPVQTYKDYMAQNMAAGGIASMAKGRYLKGHGDGMSDDIPATIEGGQPARLADGEFVVPADVVSHLGNGSSNAGAKKLYKMMDRIRTARTGKKGQAPEVKTEKYMPA